MKVENEENVCRSAYQVKDHRLITTSTWLAFRPIKLVLLLTNKQQYTSDSSTAIFVFFFKFFSIYSKYIRVRVMPALSFHHACDEWQDDVERSQEQKEARGMKG